MRLDKKMIMGGYGLEFWLLGRGMRDSLIFIKRLLTGAVQFPPPFYIFT